MPAKTVPKLVHRTILRAYPVPPAVHTTPKQGVQYTAPDAVQDAIFIHDKVLRQLIPQYCGSEVMTEGDAFILAFHEEADALLYCLHTQEALLQAPWPPAILEHENAAVWKTSQEVSACLTEARYEYMHAHLRDRLFARNSDLVRPLADPCVCCTVH